MGSTVFLNPGNIRLQAVKFQRKSLNTTLINIRFAIILMKGYTNIVIRRDLHITDQDSALLTFGRGGDEAGSVLPDITLYRRKGVTKNEYA